MDQVNYNRWKLVSWQIAPLQGQRKDQEFGGHIYIRLSIHVSVLFLIWPKGGGGTALPQFHRPCIEIPQLSASPIQLLTPPDEDSYCRPYPISATYLVMAATSLQLLRSEITTKFCSSSGNLLKALLIVSKLFFFGDGITKTSLHCSAYLLLKSYLMCLHELKLQLF